MDRILARGLMAYMDLLAARSPGKDLPIGIESVAVVTYGDFVAYAALCFEFVMTEKTSLLVLGSGGDVAVLLCRHHDPALAGSV